MTRTHEQVTKRRAQAFVLREQGYSLSYIAEQLGYRTHQAVRYILQKHDEELAHSRLYRQSVCDARKMLGIC